MLSTGIARCRQMVATASRGFSAECIASPSPSLHAQETTGYWAPAQETTGYWAPAPALRSLSAGPRACQGAPETQVPQCLTQFVLGAHHLREAVAQEVHNAQPVVFDDGVRLSSAAETTAVAEPEVAAAPTVRNRNSRSSSTRQSPSVRARVLAKLSCAFKKALTVAGIATVPWRPCHGDRAMATVPWRPCHGDRAMATVPWRPCHGDRATRHERRPSSREHSDACAAEGNWGFEHLFHGST
jgi:hypothetical protein